MIKDYQNKEALAAMKRQLNEAIKYLSDMNLYKKAISAPSKKASKKK